MPDPKLSMGINGLRQWIHPLKLRNGEGTLAISATEHKVVLGFKELKALISRELYSKENKIEVTYQ